MLNKTLHDYAYDNAPTVITPQVYLDTEGNAFTREEDALLSNGIALLLHDYYEDKGIFEPTDDINLSDVARAIQYMLHKHFEK
jgi:sulfur transfer protein SufE